MKAQHLALVLIALPALCAESNTLQPAPFPLPAKLQAIAHKFQLVKRCQFSGEMIDDALVGNASAAAPGVRAKIEAAFGEDGRYLFKVHAQGEGEYFIISNGEKTWTFLPSKKQYTEEESTSASQDSDDDGGVSAGDEGAIERNARAVVAALKTIDSSAASVGFYGYSTLKIDGQKGKWPVVRVQSKKVAGEPVRVTEIVFDPDSLAIGRIMIATFHTSNDGGRIVLRSTLQFDQFTLDDVGDGQFSFDPPKNAKLVESLAVPGRTNSLLVGHLAPDFELKTLDGDKVRLSDLRGKPVLLSFWASWCSPCRHELPTVSKLYTEYSPKGLMVFGVNDEGKGNAKRYATKANLTFPTLDDAASKASHLYGVNAIPSVFVIDKDGKIVHYLRGGREEKDLRAALGAVGL